MPQSLLILNDGFRYYDQYWDLEDQWEPESLAMWSAGVPPLDRLTDYRMIVVAGPIEHAGQATELAGGLRLAVEGGMTAVVLYPVRLKGPDLAIVTTLCPSPFGLDELEMGQMVDAAGLAFYQYFGAYGQGASAFSPLPVEVEVLGTVGGDPAAIAWKLGKGRVYVLPFHVAEMRASYNPLVRSLLTAISSYESAAVGDLALPPFVEEMRLPGEEQILGRIEDLRSQGSEAEAEATRLRRYRQILGSATGDALEELVIEIFNLILADTDCEAEDREDVKAEDFWLVEKGKDRALVEVKGIGGSVNRQAVNQVDNHRVEHELSVEAMPGVLVVNSFRNSDDAEKRSLPVSSDVIKHAVRQNVLVLRTRDLFYLLHQHLAGGNAGEVLVGALEGGGGWFEVDEAGAGLRDE